MNNKRIYASKSLRPFLQGKYLPVRVLYQLRGKKAVRKQNQRQCLEKK